MEAASFGHGDDETTPFLRQVLLDLRDVVRALRKEKSELSAGISDAIQELSEVKSRNGECVVALTAKLREHEASLVGLGARVAKLEKHRRIILFLFGVFAVMLVSTRIPSTMCMA